MEVVLSRGFYTVFDVTVRCNVQITSKNVIFGILTLHLDGQDDFFDLAGNGTVGRPAFIQLYELLSNSRSTLNAATATEGVMECCTGDAADVERAFVVKILILNSDRCLLHIFGNLFALNRNAFLCLIVLQQQRFAT